MLQIETNINDFLVKLPVNIRLKKDIRDNIAEFIRKDIEDNLNSGVGIDGKSLPPKKDGGRLFYQTGTLINSVIKNLFAESAIVKIGSIRAEIASYLNSGTNRMPKREFFGISQKALQHIDGFLINKKFEDLFESRLT